MPESNVTDLLADYRVDVEGSAEAMARRARERGEAVLKVFSRGGPPVAVTESSLWLSDESTVYRLPRERVQKTGPIRSTNYTRMRWGVAIYLLSLIGFFVHPIVTGVLALVGGALVVLGFLAKALVVQLDDERIPPFVVEHRKWRRIRDTLDTWVDDVVTR